MSKFIKVDDIDFTFYSVYEGKDEDGRDVYRRTEIAFKSDIMEKATEEVVSIQEYNELKRRLESAESCIKKTKTYLGQIIEKSPYLVVDE